MDDSKTFAWTPETKHRQRSSTKSPIFFKDSPNQPLETPHAKEANVLNNASNSTKKIMEKVEQLRSRMNSLSVQIGKPVRLDFDGSNTIDRNTKEIDTQKSPETNTSEDSTENQHNGKMTNLVHHIESSDDEDDRVKQFIQKGKISLSLLQKELNEEKVKNQKLSIENFELKQQLTSSVNIDENNDLLTQKDDLLMQSRNKTKELGRVVNEQKEQIKSYKETLMRMENENKSNIANLKKFSDKIANSVRVVTHLKGTLNLSEEKVRALNDTLMEMKSLEIEFSLVEKMISRALLLVDEKNQEIAQLQSELCDSESQLKASITENQKLRKERMNNQSARFSETEMYSPRHYEQNTISSELKTKSLRQFPKKEATMSYFDQKSPSMKSRIQNRNSNQFSDSFVEHNRQYDSDELMNKSHEFIQQMKTKRNETYAERFDSLRREQALVKKYENEMQRMKEFYDEQMRRMTISKENTETSPILKKKAMVDTTHINELEKRVEMLERRTNTTQDQSAITALLNNSTPKRPNSSKREAELAQLRTLIAAKAANGTMNTSRTKGANAQRKVRQPGMKAWPPQTIRKGVRK